MEDAEEAPPAERPAAKPRRSLFAADSIPEHASVDGTPMFGRSEDEQPTERLVSRESSFDSWMRAAESRRGSAAAEGLQNGVPQQPQQNGHAAARKASSAG